MDIQKDNYIRSLFLENGQKLKFKMGQSLSDDNYLSGSVYYIENGSARVIYKEGNKFKTISKISSGACVGAISLIRFSACENIRASTELLTFKISDQQFKDLYNKDSRFREFFDSNIAGIICSVAILAVESIPHLIILYLFSYELKYCTNKLSHAISIIFATPSKSLV